MILRIFPRIQKLNLKWANISENLERFNADRKKFYGENFSLIPEILKQSKHGSSSST